MDTILPYTMLTWMDTILHYTMCKHITVVATIKWYLYTSQTSKNIVWLKLKFDILNHWLIRQKLLINQLSSRISLAICFSVRPTCHQIKQWVCLLRWWAFIAVLAESAGCRPADGQGGGFGELHGMADVRLLQWQRGILCPVYCGIGLYFLQ